MKKFLETGKIVSTHGIKGEVNVLPWCDTPQVLTKQKVLYLDGGKKKIAIENARVHKNMVLLKIEGVDTVEDAAALRNKVLYVDRQNIRLKRGSFFIQDLIGLKVVDEAKGTEYGILSDVSQTGANDVYHIRKEDGREVLIPAIKEVIRQVKLEEGVMLIRPLEGLFDDED